MRWRKTRRILQDLYLVLIGASAASIHDGHDARAYALLAAAFALSWWHDITPTDTGDDTP